MNKPANHLKTVTGVFSNPYKHWVGNGFYVNNIFPTNDLDNKMNPFLLLDYAAPYPFAPSNEPHGVGKHPHRGFETITIVYQGAITHRDSNGSFGTIKSGDVQWMTAGSGLIHEEMYENNFLKTGGILEMVQLWVNLPKNHKNTHPNYQTLLKKDIPIINLPENRGFIRIIAGTYQNIYGIAKTFSPINLYDIQLESGSKLEVTLPEHYNTGIFILQGELLINKTHTVKDIELAVLTPEGTIVTFEAKKDTRFLILNGKAILEPIVRKGPFVMNTQEELKQAYKDYHSGKMGNINK